MERAAHMLERRHRLRGKTTLREIRRALHEQHHWLRSQVLLDAIVDVHGNPFLPLAA
jgi:hypothetical protein